MSRTPIWIEKEEKALMEIESIKARQKPQGLNISSKFLITPTKLEIVEKLSEKEYLQAWEFLGHMQGKLLIYVGDLANQEGAVINGVRSETYDKIVEMTPYTRKSIQQAKWVMGCIDPSNRLESRGGIPQGCGRVWLRPNRTK